MRTVFDAQDIHLVTVATVDNEGEDCRVCDDATARVQANVYLPTPESSRGEVRECCLRCVVPLIRDSSTNFRVLVEVAA
jgi:hypothetical protein